MQMEDAHPDIKVHGKPLDSMEAVEMQRILDLLGWTVKEVQWNNKLLPFYTIYQRTPNTDLWELCPPFMLIGAEAARFPRPILAMRAALRIHFKMLRKNKDAGNETDKP